MDLSKKQRIFTLMVAELILYAYSRGMELIFGEVYRSREQQGIYLESGRTRTMNSKHLERLAVDFNLLIDGEYVRDREKYRPLGEEWERLGGRWGGRFGVRSEEYAKKVGWDAGHFEYMD